MTDTPLAPAPAPDQSARDAFGRLVAASWGAAPAQHAGRWLAAIDGSEGSLRAASMAARLIAIEPSVGIDVVHVHPWRVKEAAEVELASRGWHATAAARALMDQAGIAWRLHVRMGEAAEEIVALAQELGSQGIVIGSHGLTATETLMLGSVAQRVVHLGKMPVLIVP